MKSIIDSLPAIVFLSDRSLTRLSMLLKEDDYLIFELNGTNITDKLTFYAAAIDVLPHDPPLRGHVRWEAFKDSVWEGLSKLGRNKVALVWTHVDAMLQSGVQVSDKAKVFFTEESGGDAWEAMWDAGSSQFRDMAMQT